MNYKFKLSPEDLRNKKNYYGYLVYLKDNYEIPVICGHGGDKWLCPSCAHEITEFSQCENNKEPVVFSCPVCPLCNRIIYPNSDWTFWPKSKTNFIAVHSKCLKAEK